MWQPGKLEGGGIIRDNNGVVKTTFSAHFGNGANNGAELKAILEGIRLCKQLELFNVVDWCQKGRCTLCYLWDFWVELKRELQGVNYVVMHQYQEGNNAIDFLAREGERERIRRIMAIIVYHDF